MNTKFSMLNRQINIALVALGAGCGQVLAAPPESPKPVALPQQDLTSLSLEQLMDIKVEIVSKKAESVASTPAAVTVITADDIRRSGATSIPEILRMAPGVQVARVSASSWAVSIRGFNDAFANKLLVLQDGRSLYTPLFSGTFWDVQDTLLQDIERIEIIRGPGATVWGANAVNGVINIITKSAKDTQGVLITGGGGSEIHGLFGARYGMKLSEDLFLRIYGKYVDHDNLRHGSGQGAPDGYYQTRGGFRMDWLPDDTAKVTFQGDLYGGKESGATGQGGVGGGNLLGRWTREFAADTSLHVQAYYDRSVRQSPSFNEDRDTGDLEIRYVFPAGDSHELSIGAGYRVSNDRVGSTPAITLVPDRRVTHLASAFVQDQITLVPDRLELTLGTKLEHNQFTGGEIQPGARLSYQVRTNQSVWVSAARAVRTPSRAEDDVALFRPAMPPAVPVNTMLSGQRGYESEEMIALELGYRVQVIPRMTFEVATFYNTYDNLRSIEPAGVTPGLPPTVNFVASNNLEGEAYGIEFAPSAQVLDWWRIGVSYSLMDMDLRPKPGSGDGTSALEERQNAHHVLSFRSQMNLPRNFELDSQLRYTDALPQVRVPAYWALDVRLGWRFRPNMTLSVVGQNLLDNSHPEFGPTLFPGSQVEVERSIFGSLTVTF